MALHPTFTGSSRRVRQVNLSGRPSNPFASSSSTGGTHSAIASAQQDRIHRQQQRERLQASSRIQRVWRGHSARRRTFDDWRQIWDALEERDYTSHGGYKTAEDSLRQLNRLALFYSPDKDVRRLTWYSMRQMATSDTIDCSQGPWPKAYLKIQEACIQALRRKTSRESDLYKAILTVLAFAARRTDMSQQDAISYYGTLTDLQDAPSDALQSALISPLASSTNAYLGLAVLLSKPLDTNMLALLRFSIDPAALTNVLGRSQDFKSGVDTRSRLWLLGNTIYLARELAHDASTRLVAHLLGSLADDVDFESTPVDLDNITFDRDVLLTGTGVLPFNKFLQQQVSSLIDQRTVRNLLVRTDIGNENRSGSTQLLASYALTLLRCFPRKADDIRMWLYLGPTNASSSDLPASLYFWKFAKATSVFSTIRQSSRDVLDLVRAPQVASQVRDEWTVILIFLELYTFLLKIMDDEEFRGSGDRHTAIPLPDVATLVTFLKNLGFTLYFNSADLNGTDSSATKSTNASLSSRFSGINGSSTAPTGSGSSTRPRAVAGLAGITVDYLKGLTTSLLRAIYERDSRRRFLEPDHWLMTSRFDMTSFIGSVVLEEQSRHDVEDEDGVNKDEEEEEEEEEEEIILGFASRSRVQTSALRSQAARERAQRKASNRRHLEAVAPRLEILQNMPFFIPFMTRVEIFRQFVELDQRKRRGGHTDPDMWRHSMMWNSRTGQPSREVLARHHAKIRRKNEFGDAFEQFYDLGAGLKEPIQITFVDEFDIPEAGIDGGGVTKEFLTSVISQAFDVGNVGVEKFFVENEKHLLHPNPTVFEDLKARYRAFGFADHDSDVKDELRSSMRQYEFLGRIIGKCLYEGILVDVNFAGFFLKKWALTGGTGSAPMESGYRANINDVRELDEDLYRGLLSLKENADVEQLGLTFTVDDMIGADDHKQVIERELIPNGSNTNVTNENRLLYINRMSWYRLQGQAAPQTNAFLRGLGSIIQPSWLSMFNQSELQTLIGGASASIDVQDLRNHTQYGGTYVIGDDGREHASVRLFWNIMAQLPDVDKRAVLKFVTSTPRGPLLGFGSLNPRFSIRDSGTDENRYPTTSTCVNLLKLPMYKTETVMREKLLAAVNSGAGFDLS